MKSEPPPIRRILSPGLYLLVGLFLAWLFVQYSGPTIVGVAYSEWLDRVAQEDVTQVWISETRVRAALRPEEEGATPKYLEAVRPPSPDPSLTETLNERGIPFSGKVESDQWWTSLIWLLPLLFLALPYFILSRALRGAGGAAGGAGPMSFGKNKAKLYDEGSKITVTFDDVAGVDEAKGELEEVIDFLRNPEKYRDLGAEIPKGVLLVGPPGTGKTLLARAVAGESGVPFFSMSGSSFVEMFVGVGASRVRDLFAQALDRAPCIIFIDEIDAIGRSRGGLGALGTNDEREQTLNQLLAEMDGFDPRKGVILMAATNRPEVLDRALVRSGRFDRQVVVDRPDLAGRLAILKVHAAKVALDPQVDLELVARRTPGMVGADMAKLVNEAALAAARRHSKSVAQIDFEEAVDRVQLGLKKRGSTMNVEEQRRVAYHEAGHALVAMSVEHADPVHRVSIIPRSIGALGITLQLPTEERHLMTQPELEDQIAVMMGGRAAEQLCFNNVSTGAQNDIERATETARQMVCRFGMSERLGAQAFGRESAYRFLEGSGTTERDFSEKRAVEIDEEISRILREAQGRAQSILTEKRALLEALTARLMEVETVDALEIERIAAKVK